MGTNDNYDAEDHLPKLWARISWHKQIHCDRQSINSRNMGKNNIVYTNAQANVKVHFTLCERSDAAGQRESGRKQVREADRNF